MAEIGASLVVACLAAGALSAACSQPEPAEKATKAPAKSQPPVVPEPPEEPFAKDVRGLRLRRSIVVRAAPDLEAEKLGTVAAHTVVGWTQVRKAAGCDERWIEIAPRGWVCERYLEAVKTNPIGVELPKRSLGMLVPGHYAKVVGDKAKVVTIAQGKIIAAEAMHGSATLRKRRTISVDGESHWQIEDDRYIAESSLRQHEPSEFAGLRLQDVAPLELPIAFAVSTTRPADGWVAVRDGGGQRVRRIKARSVVSLLDSKADDDGKISSYRIADQEWIRASDLRVVETKQAPENTLANERWFDIDLDSQVLVAYEGEDPVYATLVSSGNEKNPSPTGIYRIWIKFSETDMSGRMGASDEYSVATVPWTQFYEGDFALHTAYWHDRFGEVRSHGCINLSPHDARFLYFWSDPQVPPGWSMANGNSQTPGSMVRVRSSHDPSPEFKGRHGLQVHAQRRTQASL